MFLKVLLEADRLQKYFRGKNNILLQWSLVD